MSTGSNPVGAARQKTCFGTRPRHLGDAVPCSDEQADFEFDFKVLLTAPVEVILERLRKRTTNSFGKTPAERDRVLADLEWVSPMLGASADLIIKTTRPITGVADMVIDAVSLRLQWGDVT